MSKIILIRNFRFKVRSFPKPLFSTTWGNINSILLAEGCVYCTRERIIYENNFYIIIVFREGIYFISYLPQEENNAEERNTEENRILYSAHFRIFNRFAFFNSTFKKIVYIRVKLVLITDSQSSI